MAIAGCDTGLRKSQRITRVEPRGEWSNLQGLKRRYSVDLKKGTTYGPSGIMATAGSPLAATLSSTAECTDSTDPTPVRARSAGLRPVL